MAKKSGENLPAISADTAKEVVKRKGNNPTGIGGFGDVDVQPGDNARYLRHAMGMWDLPLLDIADAEAVEERIKWYFGYCIQDDMKPTVSGLAMALGVNRKTLNNWNRGETRGVSHLPVVKKAMAALEILWEDYMQNGKINPVSGIFLGKNHFGYTDKQEIIVEPKNPLGEADDPEAIKQKYLAEHPEDDDND